MSQENLDTLFEQALKDSKTLEQIKIPQDVPLRLYAFYKQATIGCVKQDYSTNSDLRNSFKMNAWLQVANLTVDEAKQNYIEIINSLLTNNDKS